MVIRRRYFTSIFIFCLMISGLWAQRVTLTASKTTFSIQEQIQLVFTFENIKNSPRSVDLNLHNNFTVIGGPYSSSNYSWVNGKATSSNKIIYDVIAKKTGKIKIPAYEFSIKNHVYKTSPLFITVRKTADPGSLTEGQEMPSIYMETILPKDRVYQGETFTLYYHLYTAEQVVNYTTNPISTMDGFIVDRFSLHDSPSSSKKVINGREYLIAGIASLTLTPTESGEFILPAKPFRISVKRSGQYRSKWEDPFFGNTSKNINIVAPADTLTVLQLPSGAGAAFTGAIGDFTMHVSMDSTLIQENQAATLRVNLIGHGNMDHFTFPEQTFSDDFELFEPKVKNAYRLSDQDYKGQRTWEYVLIPGKPGTYQFNDMVFTYFSLSQESYKTLRMPLKEIRVISYNELEGDYISGLSPDEVRLLSQDIRFIQMGEKHRVHLDYNAVRDSRNWVWYYLALAMTAFVVVAEVLLAFRNKNRNIIRYKNALKTAIMQFRKIHTDQSAEEILTQIETGFQTYLSDKRIAPDRYPEINDILKTIETYKYAPSNLSHAVLDSLKNKALTIIEEIEKA